MAVTLLLAFCAMSVGVPVAAAAAAVFSGRVVGVADGDTLTVLSPDLRTTRVRLVEIDAPEHDQPWGARAKQELSSRVFGRTVLVESHGRDRYGRTLGRVFADKRDINAELVAMGAAWAYRAYLTDPRFLDLEAKARLQRRGLWSLPPSQIQPPWEWRHGKSVAATRSLRTLSRVATGSPLQAGAAPLRTAPACGQKRYCSQMSSCAEARFYMVHCGRSGLDGDRDGVPCETLCR